MQKIDNKNDFLISIITITKNDYKGLEITLNSIKEKGDYIELIIVDGSKSCSSENFYNQKKLTNIKDIKIIKQKSEGLFNAMNEGIRESKGKYLIFMNGGDQFHKDFKFTYFMKYINKDFEMLIFQTLIYSPYLKRNIGINPPFMPQNKKQFILLANYMPSIFWPSHQSCLFKKEVHKKMLYPKNTVGSDEIIMRFFMKKRFIVINNICAITDTAGRSSISPSKFNNFLIQLKDSYKLKQYFRVFRITIFYTFRFILYPANIDRIRIVKYKIIDFIIFFFLESGKILNYKSIINITKK